MSIEFEGIDAVLTRIRELYDTDNIVSAMNTSCALVEKTAKQKAAKDTGALRRSITSKVESSDIKVEGVVYTPLEYAPYVEYGTGLFAESGGRQNVPWHYKDEKGEWHITSGQQPQPFMRPALNENRDKIIQTIKEGLIK